MNSPGVTMNYTVNFCNWDSVFAVPSVIVDQHIKLAGAVQLKVMLWVLRHGGKPFQPEDAAAALNLSTGDVTDALQYWIAVGLINQPNGETAPVQPAKQTLPSAAEFFEEIESPAAEPVPAPAPTPASTKVVRRAPKPTGLVISERINESEEISYLMQEAQNILGKTLSPALSSTLLAAHDDYGLPVEVLIMLLMYVKGIGKYSTQYIDAVARGWAEDEIFTYEAAEKKLHQLSQIAQAWRKIETALSIDHRSPSAREEEYTNRWVFEWRFPMNMIREAYERCVDATGKLRLGYMNKILERWYRNGILTIEQAHADLEERTAKQTVQTTQERTYDIDAFDDMDFTSEIAYSK